MPPLPGPAGFERSFLLSANTTGDLERAFASIQLGELPERPPLMLAFPSALEDRLGAAGPGRPVAVHVRALGAGRRPWDQAALERAADHAWRTAEKASGTTLEPVERQLTGPLEWVAATATPRPTPTTWR
jgi:hypothetical protein